MDADNLFATLREHLHPSEKEAGSTIFIGVAQGKLYGINIEGATTETIQETEEYTCLTMRLKSRQVKLTGTISVFYVSMIPSAFSM
ncbi:MAG: hypothetical protein PUK16_03605 [Prevotellaceae bacterium]|nr:hypothetical protein [Prevotellaceae bacterium]